MDLNTVADYRFARTRADLALVPGESFVAGGTWTFSEPQDVATGLVDLTTMGWPPVEYVGDGLRIAATCTLAELAALPEQDGWRAHALFAQCTQALLASWKIWNVATVGGNICRSYAAAAMVSLCAALDATATVWTSDGESYDLPVADLITGDGTNVLQPGDILRSVDLPGHALRARTAFRSIALATLGRSAAVLIGRVDEDGSAVLTITAATSVPTVLRYPAVPRAATLRADVDNARTYYTDAMGTADWRRAVSGVLLEEIRAELAG